MAHGLSDDEMKKEHFDSKQGLEDELDELAKWIKESQHFIVFTGMSQGRDAIPFTLLIDHIEQELVCPRQLAFQIFVVEWTQCYPRDLVLGNYESMFY